MKKQKRYKLSLYINTAERKKNYYVANMADTLIDGDGLTEKEAIKDVLLKFVDLYNVSQDRTLKFSERITVKNIPRHFIDVTGIS